MFEGSDNFLDLHCLLVVPFLESWHVEYYLLDDFMCIVILSKKIYGTSLTV